MKYLTDKPSTWSEQLEAYHIMAKKVDTNQQEIVEALRGIGASVAYLHELGRGLPDIVVGYRGVSYLLEIKQRGEGLTPAEERWHRGWRGQVAVVYCVDDALAVVCG